MTSTCQACLIGHNHLNMSSLSNWWMLIHKQYSMHIYNQLQLVHNHYILHYIIKYHILATIPKKATIIINVTHVL